MHAFPPACRPAPDPARGGVLILEDDPDVRAAALGRLGAEQWRLTVATDRPERLAADLAPDLVVLGGLASIARDTPSRLREAFRAPVIPLFRPSVYRRPGLSIRRLDADFALGLLDCRSRVGQQMEARAAADVLKVRWGDFTLELAPAAFAFRGRDLGLTRAEGAILSLLMRHSGELVSVRMIEEAAFRHKPRSETNFVSVHICRLRAKLKATHGEIFIENVRGVGYALFWTRSFSSDAIPQPTVTTGRGACSIDDGAGAARRSAA